MFGIFAVFGFSSRPALASSMAPTPDKITRSYCGRAADALIFATISDVVPVRSAITRAPVACSNGFGVFRTGGLARARRTR